MTGTDPAHAVWEALYAGGHRQRYPWDMVVSFVLRHAPRDSPRAAVRILEVGCGAAANLWFAAREGFTVAGIDASASAIAAARARFDEEKLDGDLRVGDFAELPFGDESFDLVIDRGALTCCGTGKLRRALAEVRRTLVPDGMFLFNPYSDKHSSRASGTLSADDLVSDITVGTLVDRGPIRFSDRADLDALLGDDWQRLSLEHVEIRNELDDTGGVHAEWRVILRKPVAEA